MSMTDRPATSEPAGGKHISASIVAVMGILAAGYVLLGVFMWRLGFQFFRDDIVDFWNDSFNLQTPFSTSRMPIYPVFLAAVRTLTFGAFPPVIVMMAVNLICLLAGAWCVSEIARLNGASRGLAAAGALLFGLWPLSGLPFTVYPLSDVLAMSLFVGGIYFLRRKPKWIGFALIAAAMMAHKVMWPLGILVVIADAMSEQPRPSIIALSGRLFAIVLPIIGLWVAGAFYYHSPTWLIDWNVRIHIVSDSSLPILDGAIGTFLQGGAKGPIKGLYLLSVAALAVSITYFSYRDKTPMYWYGIAICLVVVGIWLSINQYEIWALARFGRLLALPLTMVCIGRFNLSTPLSPRLRFITITGVSALLASQFAYAWYMVKVFYV